MELDQEDNQQATLTFLFREQFETSPGQAWTKEKSKIGTKTREPANGY